MTNTVSQSYLDGIRAGRELLKAWQAEGQTDTTELARASIDNLRHLCAMFDAQSPVGQLARGERDFWRNQLNKGA